MNDSSLLHRLQDLEVELHRIETRRNRNRIEQLLHPDFMEFARSGRRYSRDEVLTEFSMADAALEPVHAERFELIDVGIGAALLTYLSAHKTATSELYRHTLRSSLWVETETGWRMLFHQGTPVDADSAGEKRVSATHHL